MAADLAVETVSTKEFSGSSVADVESEIYESRFRSLTRLLFSACRAVQRFGNCTEAGTSHAQRQAGSVNAGQPVVHTLANGRRRRYGRTLTFQQSRLLVRSLLLAEALERRTHECAKVGNFSHILSTCHRKTLK